MGYSSTRICAVHDALIQSSGEMTDDPLSLRESAESHFRRHGNFTSAPKEAREQRESWQAACGKKRRGEERRGGQWLSLWSSSRGTERAHRTGASPWVLKKKTHENHHMPWIASPVNALMKTLTAWAIPCNPIRIHTAGASFERQPGPGKKWQGCRALW